MAGRHVCQLYTKYIQARNGPPPPPPPLRCVCLPRPQHCTAPPKLSRSKLGKDGSTTGCPWGSVIIGAPQLQGQHERSPLRCLAALPKKQADHADVAAAVRPVCPFPGAQLCDRQSAFPAPGGAASAAASSQQPASARRKRKMRKGSPVLAASSLPWRPVFGPSGSPKSAVGSVQRHCRPPECWPPQHGAEGGTGCGGPQRGRPLWSTRDSPNWPRADWDRTVTRSDSQRWAGSPAASTKPPKPAASTPAVSPSFPRPRSNRLIDLNVDAGY